MNHDPRDAMDGTQMKEKRSQRKAVAVDFSEDKSIQTSVSDIVLSGTSFNQNLYKQRCGAKHKQ